jgi:predicted MFS family arabinose efflux permease
LVAQSIIAHHGWRAGYLTLGLLALLGFPLSARLLRNKPGAQATSVKAYQNNSVRDVLGSRIFWLIAVMILLGAFGANGVLSHLAALLSERGVSGGQTALALSCLGGAGIAGRLLTGYLLDRFHAPTLSLFMFLLCALGMTCFAFASTAAVSIAGALLLGFGMGSESDIAPYLISRYFGQGRFATLYGLSWTAYAIGGATGPVLTGHLYDRLGSYRPGIILLLAVTSAIAAFMNLALPRYTTQESLEMPLSAVAVD